MRLRAPARVTPSEDDGFSLVEAVVALAIATAIFTALAFALVGGAKSALLSQQNQQAGDVLNQAVEQARALSYHELVMRTSDLDAGEPTDASRTPSISSCQCYNPSDDSTSGATEPLVVPDPNGGLVPHVTQVAQNGGTFTVRRYVTVPADASGAVYKRLTVVVDWTTLGKERSRTYSTLIAETKRGLPLPDFKFTNAAGLTQCRNHGSTVAYAFNLQNNGARDGWNLSTTPTTPTWSYYADSNSNGVYDDGTDTALPVTAGVPGTGSLEPTTARDFFAVRLLPASATSYTLSTTFRATSAAQPTYWQELATTTVVQSAACAAVPSASPTATPSPSSSPTAAPPTPPTQPDPSCSSLTGAAATSAPGGTLYRYYPMNPSQPGNTVASFDMPVLKSTAPAASSLYNYSTDLHSVAGRYVNATAATWTYGMPATSILKGDGEVTLWAAPADGSTTARPTFQVRLERLSSTGAVLSTIDTESFTPGSGWGCTGMRPLSFELDDIESDTSIAANEKLRLSVRITNGVPVRLGYGTTAYPMTMTLPIRSGVG